jgi:hypothetical protein
LIAANPDFQVESVVNEVLDGRPVRKIVAKVPAGEDAKIEMTLWSERDAWKIFSAQMTYESPANSGRFEFATDFRDDEPTFEPGTFNPNRSKIVGYRKAADRALGWDVRALTRLRPNAPSTVER